MKQAKRDLATKLERIEYSLKDIREALRLYPDPSHPYVQEKLTERDGLLSQWQRVTAQLNSL